MIKCSNCGKMMPLANNLICRETMIKGSKVAYYKLRGYSRWFGDYPIRETIMRYDLCSHECLIETIEKFMNGDGGDTDSISKEFNFSAIDPDIRYFDVEPKFI